MTSGEERRITPLRGPALSVVYYPHDDAHVERRISRLGSAAEVLVIDVPAGTRRTGWVARTMLERLGKHARTGTGGKSDRLDVTWLMAWLAVSDVRLLVLNRAHLLMRAILGDIAEMASLLDMEVILVANPRYCTRHLRDCIDAWGAEPIDFTELWERAEPKGAR